VSAGKGSERTRGLCKNRTSGVYPLWRYPLWRGVKPHGSRAQPRSGNQFFAFSNVATDHVAGRTSFVVATTCLVAARTKLVAGRTCLVAGRTCLVAGRTSFVGGTTCHVATRTCHVAGRTNLVVATTKLVATRTSSKFRRKRSGNRPNLIVFDSCRFSQAGVPGGSSEGIDVHRNSPNIRRSWTHRYRFLRRPH
jgi:hypothetical protein